MPVPPEVPAPSLRRYRQGSTGAGPTGGTGGRLERSYLPDTSSIAWTNLAASTRQSGEVCRPVESARSERVAPPAATIAVRMARAVFSLTDAIRATVGIATVVVRSAPT